MYIYFRYVKLYINNKFVFKFFCYYYLMLEEFLYKN